jgi:hypothetical protein
MEKINKLVTYNRNTDTSTNIYHVSFMDFYKNEFKSIYQGASRWPYSFNLAGEIGKRALQRCYGNIQDLDEKRKQENM